MKKKIFSLLIFVSLIIVLPMFSFASEAPKVDSGDTAFMFLATVLVFVMTPGLALFYGGMVRKKNVLNTMMNSFVIMALITIQWVLFGYSIAFGSDAFYGMFGGFEFFGFSGVGGDPSAYAGTIPHGLFAMFQLMFAIITPALISGSFAERFRFPAFLAFVLMWSTFVYDPLAHWVWGAGGWLMEIGALDFAGGTVVHISSGIAGLVIAIVIGKRKDYNTSATVPHNIPFIMLGAALLWFGWFGFNAGSALSISSGSLAITAFITTNASAAAALISWMLVEWIFTKKPTLMGASTGAVIGLVAITPAAGFVSVMHAIVIGLVASPLCYFGISVAKKKFGYDDSLDAFGCHGIGGIWGAVATGLFCNPSINSYAKNYGLFLGGGIKQLWIQLISIGATIVLSAVVTYVSLQIISLFTSLRVTPKDETQGLDIAEHGETAYPDFAA